MKLKDRAANSIEYELTSDHKLHRRRKQVRPPVAGARRRVVKDGIGSTNQTLLRKLREKDNNPWMELELRGFERLNSEAEAGVSARKLAAGLWHLAAEFTTAGVSTKRQCGLIHPLHSWIPITKSAMEGATKLDPSHFKMSREVGRSNSPAKLYESRLTATPSVAPALQVELIKAWSCIQKLEAERGHLRKKFKHFVRKLNEERTSRMGRERQKMHAAINGLIEELRRERRFCKRLDAVNSKLLVDLAELKLSARRYKHDYEKEIKSRELLEDVCNELVKEIEEDKAEIEALKSESAKIGKEVEEERKRLQLAEVWREERVQMKLIDAKLILEEKCCLMSNIISALESFLRSNNLTVDVTDLSESQVVKQVVDSLKIQEINEFSSGSPISNRISTTNEGSIICEAKKLALNKDASGRETVTEAEYQFSTYTVGENEHSVNGIDRGRYLLSGKVSHEQNTGQSGCMDLETSEISSVLTKQSKKRGSSFRKLWRSSLSSDDFCKTISLNESGRVSNGSTSNVDIVCSENVPAETELAYQDFANHCCSGGPRNPHITRAMKGCIEWPRGIPKYGLKSKLLEARLESQKMQLRNYT